MGRIYLDSNGITIKCENCVVGEKLMFNGEKFEVVDNQLLRQRVKEKARLNRLVTSMVTDMSELFMNNIVKYSIVTWDVSSVTDMSYMFSNSDFKNSIVGWDLSSVTNMSNMFDDENPFIDPNTDYRP